MRNSPPSRIELAHSLLSPSSSKRWTTCRASVGFIEKHKADIPAEGTSVYAEEGTTAHTLGERLLRGQKVVRPKSSEMVACIEDGYVPFVQEQIRRVKMRRFEPEVRVPLFYDRSQFGTCDAPILGDDLIVIIDLKYGQGISVEAKNNKQLAIYGESAIQDRERRTGIRYRRATPVELVIYQPRAQDNRFVRRWVLTRGELTEFCASIQEAAHSIIMEPDDQPFHADPETICRFCPAKAFCSSYAASLLEELPEQVAKPLQTAEMRLHMPSVSKLGEHQLVKLVSVRKALVDWLDEIEVYLINRMQKGHRYEGLKLTEGRTNRQWKDEEEAQKYLLKILTKDDIFKTTFKSPSQIGELLKGLRKQPPEAVLARIQKLIIKPPGAPTLAVRDDPAPELNELL